MDSVELVLDEVDKIELVLDSVELDLDSDLLVVEATLEVHVLEGAPQPQLSDEDPNVEDESSPHAEVDGVSLTEVEVVLPHESPSEGEPADTKEAAIARVTKVTFIANVLIERLSRKSMGFK